MPQTPLESQVETSPIATSNSGLGRVVSIWRWSKLQTAPAAHLWCSLYVFVILILTAVYLPELLSFSSFAFMDSGSGLAADDLVRRGLRPAVDFGYYHGLLPLMLGRIWFSAFGQTPYAYLALRVLLAIVSSIAVFYLFRTISAPRIIYVMFCVAIPFTFFYLPSLNHDWAAFGVMLSLLLVAGRRFAGGASAALVSGFCHPSLGYLMFVAAGLAALLSCSGTITRRLARTAYSLGVSAGITLLIYLVACQAFFGSPVPFLKTLLPLGGSGVRAHYHWSFLNGGLAFIHPAGSNWKYLAGTSAGPYVLFNLILLAAFLATVAQLLRKWPVERGPILFVFICCVAIHVIYVVFVFGVPETWSYDAYLLVLGAAALPFARARHSLAVLMTAALLVSCYGSLSASRKLYSRTREAGLWIDERLAADLQEILHRQVTGKPYVWSMAGALALIDNRFQSPARWFVVPGTTPPAELARLKTELFANKVIFLRGLSDDPNYLFQDADFADVKTRFREGERIGGFAMCLRRP